MSKKVWPKPGSTKEITIIDPNVIAKPSEDAGKDALEAWELATTLKMRVSLLKAIDREEFRRRISKLWAARKGGEDVEVEERQVFRELIIACVKHLSGVEYADGSRISDLTSPEEMADALADLDALLPAGYAVLAAQSPKPEQLD